MRILMIIIIYYNMSNAPRCVDNANKLIINLKNNE